MDDKKISVDEQKIFTDGRERRLANLAPRFQPGQSGNPGGKPAGFVRLSDAYAYVNTLPIETIKYLAEQCTFPPKWDKPRSMSYIAAARAWLELTGKPLPGLLAELADRTEGKVPQRVQSEVDIRGVIVVPASSLASADWSRNVLDAEVIDSKALPAASEDDESAE